MVEWALLDSGTNKRLPMRLTMDRRPTVLLRVLIALSATALASWRLSASGLVKLSNPAVARAVAASLLCPVYWNGASRAEYRWLGWSRALGGRRAPALYAFSASVLALSGLREAAFRGVVDAGREAGAPIGAADWLTRPLEHCGVVAFAAGFAISMSGYAQLGLKGTCMGEAFGFFCPALITSFPFNVFNDPMYFGSTLMHFGVAMQMNSLPALFVALVIGVSYWVAARVFEGPFTAQVYALQAKNGSFTETKEA